MAILLLKNSKLSYNEITIQTKIPKTSLSKINLGTHPYCQTIQVVFPIRKSRMESHFSEEEILMIKQDLLNESLSMQIIADNFSCDRSTISDINLGKRYTKIGENYPIRTFYANRKSKKPVSTILESEE